MPDSRRLFFALWPNERIRRELDAVARRYRPRQARAIPRGNLHATLIFLGSISETLLPVIKQAAGHVHVEPVELSLQQLEVWRRPQVLCLCPETTPDALQQMHDELADALQSADVAFDARQYRPHVTLARKVRHRIKDEQLAEPIQWSLSSFALVESVSTDRGVRYEPLQQWHSGSNGTT